MSATDWQILNMKSMGNDVKIQNFAKNFVKLQKKNVFGGF